MRTPIIAGNWKMNTTVTEAVALVQTMKKKLDQIRGVEKVLCPPFISLIPVCDLVKGTSIKVGAQNAHYESCGAYTGEVAPPMLAGLCEYVILGHSERRAYFCETNQTVNKKVKAAIKADLKPIICVGESLEQRETGKTEEVITAQVRGAFEGVEAALWTAIAYEPVWAIGTGRAATSAMANETIALIRSTVGQLYGKPTANAIRIQYGGSVNAANIAEFMCQPDIDGALVGGASLKAVDFLTIVEETARSKK